MLYRLSALLCTLLHTSSPPPISQALWVVIAEREKEAERREVLLGEHWSTPTSKIWEEAHRWALWKWGSPVVSQLLALLDVVCDQYILTSETVPSDYLTLFAPEKNIHNSSTRIMFDTNRIQDHCQAHLITSIHMLIKHTAAWMTHKHSHSIL